MEGIQGSKIKLVPQEILCFNCSGIKPLKNPLKNKWYLCTKCNCIFNNVDKLRIIL